VAGEPGRDPPPLFSKALGETCTIMTATLKILHTCETAMGGVGVYQKYLAGMNPDEVTQIILMPAEHAAIMDGDPRVLTYSLGRRGLGGVLSQIRALDRALEQEDPDVVVFHSSFSLLPLAATWLRRRRKNRPRLLYIAHCWAGAQYSGLKEHIVRRIEGGLSGCADLVVNISRNDLLTAQHHGYRGRHVMIETAVPDVTGAVRRDCFAPESETLNLLFVGRFDRQKGLDILLEALARAQRRRPDLRLHVIGSTVRAGRPAIFPPEVDIIGWVPPDEIDQWYRSADVLVVASRWEGLPLVIPEALRNGTPVVVSQRSGMEQLFDEGKEGFSYPLTIEALAERLATLDRAELRAMRPACRALYEKRYSMPRLHAEILRAYRDEIETSAPDRAVIAMRPRPRYGPPGATAKHRPPTPAPPAAGQTLRIPE